MCVHPHFGEKVVVSPHEDLKCDVVQLPSVSSPDVPCVVEPVSVVVPVCLGTTVAPTLEGRPDSASSGVGPSVHPGVLC